MATTALSAPSSKQWWPRLSPREPPGPSYRADSTPYAGAIPSLARRPHTATPSGRPTLMTSVTNPKPTSSNAFTSSSKSSSSKFNFASVIGFGSRSKKQQPVDIQDPPSQARSLPTPKTQSHKQFGIPPTSPASNPRLSRGVASSNSGTSRASTDGPLTPADDTAPGTRISYPQSLMTLTDLSDPFALSSPLSDRRASAHSDKSISRRLMHKADSKAAKTAARLPVGEGPKRKDSRDRSATLPSRVRSATDASEAYQPLRAVEPPWAPDSPPAAGPSPQLDSRFTTHDGALTVRGLPSGSGMLRKSKSAKPALPWLGPDARTRPAPAPGSSQGHQRSNSTSSLSKENKPEGSRGNARLLPAPGQGTVRASVSSSTRTSRSSSLYGSPLSFDSSPTAVSVSGHGSSLHSSTDAHYAYARKTPTTSAQTTPTISTQFPRSGPRPPPTHELPPTPSDTSSPISPSRLHPASEHPLRARSGTVASTSAVSFTSTLSSLSFNSRPSPQDPPPRDAYDYPSLMTESLPVPGAEEDPGRRGSNSGSSLSSGSEAKTKTNGSANSHGLKRSPTSKVPPNDFTPKQTNPALPGARPLPAPPVPAPPIPGTSPYYTRERAMSATSSTHSLSLESGKTLRKQRSFHNTSLQAPQSPPPPLRHYASFEPPLLPSANGQIRSPPLPPPHDLPPPPPPPSTPSTSTSATKRGSGGSKDTLASPRRKLFSSNKHERERKPDPEHADASGGRHPTLHHSSSWFDEASTEPASPPPMPPPPASTGHDVAQHIVPPAELLRLGAAWERESESLQGARMAKSSWDSRDSEYSRTSSPSSSKLPPPPRSAGHASSGMSPSSSISPGSKLPRSASLLSKVPSVPSFRRTRAPSDLSYAPASSPVPPESYTSLSPPPRRQQRSVYRPPTAPATQGLPPPPPPRRTISNATVPTATSTVRGALIARKPSFLDMSATSRSVSIDVPDHGEPERDSFLELSRGMDSIDTIRESEASFMQ